MRTTAALAKKGIGAESAAALPAGDLKAAAQAGSRLAEMLAAGIGDAADYFDAHRTAIGALFGRGGSAAFEKALGDFDFEAALKELRRVLDSHGENAQQGEPA